MSLSPRSAAVQPPAATPPAARRDPARHDATATIAVFAVIGAVGSASYLSTFFLLPPDTTTSVQLLRSPLVLTAFSLMFIGLGGVGMLLPAVARGVLPSWAVYVAAGSFVASAGQALATGTVVADLTLLVTEQQFQDAAGYPLTLLMGLLHGVLGLIGFLACAICGRRTGSLGWGTTVLFIVAALVSPLWHVPPAGLLGSLAVLALARGLRAEDLEDEPGR